MWTEYPDQKEQNQKNKACPHKIRIMARDTSIRENLTLYSCVVGVVALGCLVCEWRWLPEPYKRTNRDKIEHNLRVTSRTLYDDARPVFCTSRMKRLWRILYMNGLVLNCAQIPGPPGDGEGWPRKKNNSAKCSAVQSSDMQLRYLLVYLGSFI